MTTLLPFQLIQPDVGAGSPLPDSWRPLAACPLMILVGVTGVGKSTVLAHLAEFGLDYALLPDRRVLTDRLIISAMQAQEGGPIQPVTDRGLRFDYTRRYREQYRGGMAHAWRVSVSPVLAGVCCRSTGRGITRCNMAAQLEARRHRSARRVAALAGRRDAPTRSVMPSGDLDDGSSELG